MLRQASLYKLTIWFKDGNDNVEKSFTFSKITKLSPTHIKGKDVAGKMLELRTLEPVNYLLQQLK
jgi:hypothetical protein